MNTNETNRGNIMTNETGSAPVSVPIVISTVEIIANEYETILRRTETVETRLSTILTKLRGSLPLGKDESEKLEEDGIFGRIKTDQHRTNKVIERINNYLTELEENI